MSADEASWNTRLMLREVLEPTDVCACVVREYIRPLFETLMEILDELLPETVPFHQRWKIGFSVIGQCLYYRVASGVISALLPANDLPAHFGPEQLADHITHFCLAALGVQRPVVPSAAEGMRHIRRCQTRKWRRHHCLRTRQAIASPFTLAPLGRGHGEGVENPEVIVPAFPNRARLSPLRVDTRDAWVAV